MIRYYIKILFFILCATVCNVLQANDWSGSPLRTRTNVMPSECVMGKTVSLATLPQLQDIIDSNDQRSFDAWCEKQIKSGTWEQPQDASELLFQTHGRKISLHRVAEAGHEYMTKKLLDVAVKMRLLNAVLSVQDEDGNTPLHIAIERRYALVERVIRTAAYGENILSELLEIRNFAGKKPLEMVPQRPIQLSGSDDDDEVRTQPRRLATSAAAAATIASTAEHDDDFADMEVDSAGGQAVAKRTLVQERHPRILSTPLLSSQSVDDENTEEEISWWRRCFCC